MKKSQLWKLLTDRGLFPDRRTATSWIMSGKVLVDDYPISKAGHIVPEDADIRIRDYDKKFVGRGGVKLEGALRVFNIDVSGKVVLDTGASVGGFTDCLLQNGAAKVYAIDAGFGQLAGKLRIDERVVNMEKTNISDIEPDELAPKPVLATVDLSYLSLKKAVPIVSRLLDRQGEMLCLVKPLFETADPEIRRTGKIDSSLVYKEVLYGIVSFVEEIGFCSIGVTHSHITGNSGTREFFILISLNKQHANRLVYSHIDNAIKMTM